MGAETNIEAESTTWPSRVAANYTLSPYQDTGSVKSRSFCKLKSTVREGLVQGSRVEMMSRRAKLVKDNEYGPKIASTEGDLGTETQ